MNGLTVTLDLDDPAQRTLGNVLRQRARTLSETPFVVTDEISWTFPEVDTLADRCAAGLDQLGVGFGDTVAILAESSPHLIPLTFGVNRLGAVWVPTNTDYRGEWLRASLEDSSARVLIVDRSLLPQVDRVGGLEPFDWVVVLGESSSQTRPAPAQGARDDASTISVDELLQPGEKGPDVAVSYGDTAAVLWTSGTTGRAKGVMQSHNAWIRAALTGAASSQTRAGDLLYCCLPMYNSAAWIGVVYRALVAGVPFAIDQRFSVQSFWDRVRHFGATQAFTLGSMHIFLWQLPERPDDADNPLRCLGATPMPDAILEPFKERFGIDIIQQGYGQSEIMGLISRVDDGRTEWNPGSAGKPLPGVDVRLLDDDDHEVSIGEVGEFCVRPTEPYVLFNGYFRDPQATLAAFRNLWYHTGDLGRRDEDGQFHFVDRKKDYIRFKGRSVSSFAVEAAVRSHPGVAEVAAFGVAAKTLASESEIMVAIVPKPGIAIDPEEVAQHVNKQAAYFMVPRYIDVVEELPMTPTGKVRKHVLRERGPTGVTWDREAVNFALER